MDVTNIQLAKVKFLRIDLLHDDERIEALVGFQEKSYIPYIST